MDLCLERRVKTPGLITPHRAGLRSIFDMPLAEILYDYLRQVKDALHRVMAHLIMTCLTTGRTTF